MKSTNSKQTLAGDRHTRHMTDVEAPLKSNTNNSDSADRLAPTKIKASSRLLKWLFILMAFGLTIAAIVYLILTQSTVLENDSNTNNLCKNFPFQFSQNNHNLFATKTTYTTAFGYLCKPSQQLFDTHNEPLLQATNSSQQNISQLHISQQQPLAALTNIDKSSIQIPSIFSKKDSLESLNKHLIAIDKCQVRKLYFIGRHGARFPDAQDIKKINTKIETFKRLINLVIAKQQDEDKQATLFAQPMPYSSPSTSPSSSTRQQEQDSQLQQPPPHDKTNLGCADPSLRYRQWKPFATEKQANLITELGARETRELALRFKSMFPTMFDANNTYIDLGVTSETRTVQSALQFARFIDRFNEPDPLCSLGKLPLNVTNDPNEANPEQDECFNKFKNRFLKDKLSFHTRCRANSDTKHLGLDLNNPSRTKFIVDAVNKRLGFDSLDVATDGSTDPTKTNRLTAEDVKALYDVCKYESALSSNGGTSIFCNLFNENELKFYEYLSDVDDFFNDAYGQDSHARSACAIFSGLRLAFKNALDARASQKDIRQEANFYFTHSAAIQRLIAASFDLTGDPEYNLGNVLMHLSRGTVPKGRQWQTSLFSPFSANLAFILYECPTDEVESEPVPFTGSNEVREIDVSLKTPLKLVASLNEQPIFIGNCNDYVCDLKKLMDRGRIFEERRCNFDEICKTTYKYT